MKNFPHFWTALLFLAVAAAPALAWFPRTEADSRLAEPAAGPPLVGALRSYLIGADETLIELAWRAGVGYESLARANPGVDPWLPREGTAVVLPYSALLPAEAGPGLTLNLAEYRLYHLWREGERLRVRIYPVGLGREGWETPEGVFRVVSKSERPVWTPPLSLRAERPELPPQVPPGPDNPLGDYWIGLSAPGIGLHGTNRPFGVGRRVSHGCIRLYARDIEDLARRVEIGTPVRIIYRPLKVGIRDGTLWLEAHPDYLGRMGDLREEMLRLKEALEWEGEIDRELLERALTEQRGIPVPVSAPSVEAVRPRVSAGPDPD